MPKEPGEPKNETDLAAESQAENPWQNVKAFETMFEDSLESE